MPDIHDWLKEEGERRDALNREAALRNQPNDRFNKADQIYMAGGAGGAPVLLYVCGDCGAAVLANGPCTTLHVEWHDAHSQAHEEIADALSGPIEGD